MAKNNTKTKEDLQVLDQSSTDQGNSNDTSNTDTGEPTQGTEKASVDVIEIEWNQVQHIFDFREKLVGLENYFATMCLQFEKNKANLISQITYGENDLYTMAQRLQKELNIDETLTYELKLPQQEGEKGYFVRKDT